jgi:hypothetical protein
MIINQDKNLSVPKKTIVFFPVVPDDGLRSFDLKDIDLFLKPLNKNHKRDWFDSSFYKCLPLSIGNMQGFVFSLPYRFSVLWNGGNKREDLSIRYYDDFNPYEKYNFIHPTSEFGHGVLTIHFPLTLKTPPDINLMTIAPPNFPTPGLSPMTGVIESDNIRFSFTLNLKIDLIDTNIVVEPNTPIVGMIPIPRYFCDSFELKNAYDIFSEEVVKEEITVTKEHADKRNISNKNNLGYDRIYYSGTDVRGNKFKNHQLPKKNKN